MKNKEIKKAMLQMGGHCEESLTDINNADSVEKLAEVLFDFIKPCLKKDFPTYDIMKNFKKSGEPFGVFVDSKGDFTALDQNVLYGDSEIVLKVKPYDVVRVYLKHISNVSLVVGEGAIVHLYVFDKSTYMLEGDIKKVTVKHSID